MDQDPYYHTLKMPRLLRWWHEMAAAAVVLAAIGVAIWRADSIWRYLPFPGAAAAAGVFWWRMNHLVRCPRCAKRLQPRKVDEPYQVKGSKRFLLIVTPAGLRGTRSSLMNPCPIHDLDA
jgi:hypothetical protein